MDASEDPKNLALSTIEREIDRRVVELTLVDALQALFETNKGDSNWHRDYFLDNLRKFTAEWQSPPMSGTNGEVISRWVGRGWLEDFPQFRPTTSKDKLSQVSVGSDGDNVRINSEVIFGQRPDRMVASYAFKISISGLEGHKETLLKERDFYRTIRKSKI